MSDLIRKSDALEAVAGWEIPSTAIAALPAVTLKVKPLVWVDVTDWRECTKCEAQALGGKYFVADLDKDSGIYRAGIDLGGLAFVMILEPDLTHGGRKPKSFPTLDAAKAAAQADYEARILAALDLTPSPNPAAITADEFDKRSRGYMPAKGAKP